MATGTIKSWVEGPKWKGIPSFLKKLAYETGCNIELDIDKHIISETVYFKVEGEVEKVKRFAMIYKQTMEAEGAITE